MKQIYQISLAVFGLALGCACNEIDERSGQEQGPLPISFMVDIDQTRTTTWNDQTSVKTFYVWAKKSGSGVAPDGESEYIMEGVMAEVSESGVTLNPNASEEENVEYFWPDDGSDIEFYAVADGCGMEMMVNVSDDMIGSYLLNDYLGNGHDILVAGCKLSKQSLTDGYVRLNFKHVMSKVSFEAKVIDPTYNYQITEIVMNGRLEGYFVPKSLYDITTDPWFFYPAGEIGDISVFDDAQPLEVTSTADYAPLQWTFDQEKEDGEVESVTKNIQCFVYPYAYLDQFPVEYTLKVSFKFFDKTTGNEVGNVTREVAEPLKFGYGKHHVIRLGLVSDQLNIGGDNTGGPSAD